MGLRCRITGLVRIVLDQIRHVFVTLMVFLGGDGAVGRDLRSLCVFQIILFNRRVWLSDELATLLHVRYVKASEVRSQVERDFGWVKLRNRRLVSEIKGIEPGRQHADLAFDKMRRQLFLHKLLKVVSIRIISKADLLRLGVPVTIWSWLLPSPGR